MIVALWIIGGREFTRDFESFYLTITNDSIWKPVSKDFSLLMVFMHERKSVVFVNRSNIERIASKSLDGRKWIIKSREINFNGPYKLTMVIKAHTSDITIS